MLMMAYRHTQLGATARRRAAAQVCILSMVSREELVLQQGQSDSKSAKCVCHPVKSNVNPWRAKARAPRELDMVHRKLGIVDGEITE